MDRKKEEDRPSYLEKLEELPILRKHRVTILKCLETREKYLGLNNAQERCPYCDALFREGDEVATFKYKVNKDNALAPLHLHSDCLKKILRS